MAESIFIIPGESWGIRFNSPQLLQHRASTDASTYQLEASTEIGFILSAYVEPAAGKGKSSKECMSYYWGLASRNPSIQKDTVAVMPATPFHVVTYLIEAEYQGQRFIQPNANYYGYRDGKCIDVRVSQVFPFEAEIDYSNMLEFARTFGYFNLDTE